MVIEELERMLCDTLWDIKEKYPELELSQHLHYINTFERSGYPGIGIELILVDGSRFEFALHHG